MANTTPRHLDASKLELILVLTSCEILITQQKGDKTFPEELFLAINAMGVHFADSVTKVRCLTFIRNAITTSQEAVT